jgi:hypothetical protein
MDFLKDAIDPNGILMPGNQVSSHSSIYREERAGYGAVEAVKSTI